MELEEQLLITACHSITHPNQRHTMTSPPPKQWMAKSLQPKQKLHFLPLAYPFTPSFFFLLVSLVLASEKQGEISATGTSAHFLLSALQTKVRHNNS